MKHLFLLLLSLSVFSQTKTLDLKIDSITSNDSLPNERRFTINYRIENITDKEISFFLNENTLIPAHSGSMQTSVFYKLYQENEILQVSEILNKYSKDDTSNPLQFLTIKDDNKRDIAFKKYLKETLKINTDSLISEKKGASSDSIFIKKSSKKLMNTIYKLNPKESKKYTYTFYWDKSRYFIENEMEYILDENSKFCLELYLVLMKEEYEGKLIESDFKKIMSDKTFIQGVYISNKMEINFKQ